MDESIPSGYQNSRPACFTVIFMIWTKIDSGRLARNLILGRLCCVLIGCLFCVSCEKNESLPARTNKPITMTWSQELDASRKTILQSDWHTAGVAWANIRKKGLTPEELDAWLAFQTEILSSTKNDALKSSLRKSAMQEMYYSPLQSSRYLVWLEQGLATNLFIEGDTIEKAQQLVHDIKQVKSTSNN